VSINTSIARLKKVSRIEYRTTIPEMPDKDHFIDEISTNESLKLLLDAIYNLDALDRSIMLLYLEEKQYDEIAEIIGISKSNVGVRINRAKQSLKLHFEKNSYGRL
jgi:RNA polymerase sigma-70 factor (ECF subfamily)